MWLLPALGRVLLLFDGKSLRSWQPRAESMVAARAMPIALGSGFACPTQ